MVTTPVISSILCSQNSWKSKIKKLQITKTKSKKKIIEEKSEMTYITRGKVLSTLYCFPSLTWIEILVCGCWVKKHIYMFLLSNCSLLLSYQYILAICFEDVKLSKVPHFSWTSSLAYIAWIQSAGPFMSICRMLLFSSYCFLIFLFLLSSL